MSFTHSHQASLFNIYVSLYTKHNFLFYRWLNQMTCNSCTTLIGSVGVGITGAVLNANMTVL